MYPNKKGFIKEIPWTIIMMILLAFLLVMYYSGSVGTIKTGIYDILDIFYKSRPPAPEPEQTSCYLACRGDGYDRGDCVRTGAGIPSENIFSVSVWTGASDDYLEKMVELGVGWVRVDNGGNWRHRQPNEDEYSWSSVDRIVNFARANGIEPYFDVMYTPQWATSKEPYDQRNPPDNMDDFKDFVYELVKKYNLKVISIWHEPDVFFYGTQQQYVDLTCAGYAGAKEAAKEANRDITVLGNYGYSPRHIYDDEEIDFALDDLVKLGFFNCIDALTTSTYTGGRTVGPEGSLAIWLEDLRDYLTAQGKRDMEFWDGGFGYSIAPEDVSTPAGGHWTLEEQADLTVRHSQVILNDPNVKFTNYWCLHGSGEGVYYSLIDMDTDIPRPVYYAYKNFIAENVRQSSDYEFTVDEDFEDVNNIIEYHYDSVYTRDRFDTWTVDHELVYGRGDSGDYVGQVSLSTDVSRSGSKSVKAHGDKVAVAFINFEGQVDSPWYGSRYMETKEFYVSYWIYFPSSFSYEEGIDKWTNLGDIVFEQKRDPETNELLEEMRLTFGLDSNYKFCGNKPVYYYGTRTSQSLTTEHNKYMVKEQWMHVEIYVKRDWSDGYYYVYVDGTKVVDYEGPTIHLDEKYWSKSLQLYQDEDMRNTVYWDDIEVGVKKDENGGVSECPLENNMGQQDCLSGYTCCCSGVLEDCNSLCQDNRFANAVCRAGTVEYPPTKLFSDDSYWYMKIKPNPKLHPNNDKMLDWLYNYGGNQQKHPDINWKSWTNVVYDAYENTPLYSVYNENHNRYESIPFPDPYPVQIDAQADAAVTIIDWYREKVWDLWNVRAQGGTYVAGDVWELPLYGTGLDDSGVGGEWTSGGSGSPSVAYLIRPEEIEAGVIHHVIGAAMHSVGPYTDGSRFDSSEGFVHPPAVHTDRETTSSNPNQIPAGARIQLDPAINLDALGLSTTGKIIAKALQDYGMVVAESGGSWHIYAEHDYTADWNPPTISGGLLSPIDSLWTSTYNPWRIIDFELYPEIDDMSEYELPVTGEACLTDETPIKGGCDSGYTCCCSGVLEEPTQPSDWGFIPDGYEIVFADDVEQTTWDGSFGVKISEWAGDNPNFQPWVNFFNNVHDNADILHKQILTDSDHKWYGDGDDWYTTDPRYVRRGNRAFRVNRDGQYPDPGDRMQLASRFHTEYVWYGTWIYFPEDFELDEGWFTFGGILSGHPDGGWLFRELTLNRNMDVRVNYRKDHGGGVTSDGGNWFTGITIPKGEWVHLGYIVRWHQTEGYMKFYLNGQYVSTFDKNVDSAIGDAVTRWDGDTFYFFTMKHYSHEHDYETVYWDDLVFAVPEGTEW